MSVFWSGSSSARFTDKWDDEFQDAAEFFGHDWRWSKAQCAAESNLNPLAVSPVGARGLCQFMPATWVDMLARYPVLAGASAYVPEASILANAAYMRDLAASFKAPRPGIDRRLLAQAAYNWGARSVYRAQDRCASGTLYGPLVPCLPDETRTYNERIMRYYTRTLFGIQI